MCVYVLIALLFDVVCHREAKIYVGCRCRLLSKILLETEETASKAKKWLVDTKQSAYDEKKNWLAEIKEFARRH